MFERVVHACWTVKAMLLAVGQDKEKSVSPWKFCL